MLNSGGLTIPVIIYLKCLSVEHRQFGDTEFTRLWGAMKTGYSFSLIKPILHFYLADFYGFDVITCCFSQGCKISTGFQGPTHRENPHPIFSHSSYWNYFLYQRFILEDLHIADLEKKKNQNQKLFTQAKIWLPQTYGYSLICNISLTGPEKYLNFHITVCAFRPSSPVLRLLLAMIEEASAFGTNYISLSPTSASAMN